MSDNGTPLAFGRFDEYRRATDQRLIVLERHSEELRGQSAEHQAIRDRLGRLEEFHKADAESDRSRRDRTWIIGLTLASGIVFPILVTAVITFLHLKG